MKTKPKKRRTKYWFIQDCGTYTNQIPVFVGYNIKEITEIIKRQKWLKEPKEAWIKDHEFTTSVFDETKSGGVWFNDGYAVFWMKDFADDWTHYETIMHECFHLVIYMLGRQKTMINHSSEVVEEEAMAYQQEYLFRSIRGKLQDAFNIKR